MGTVALAVPVGSANAAWTSCPSGKTCLWLQAGYSGSISNSWTASAAGFSINAGSWGNRLASNKCVVYYRTNGSQATIETRSGTGGTFSTQPTAIGSLSVYTC